MSKSTSSSTNQSASADSDVVAGQNAVADITRQQLATLAETASALFRATEAVQQVQQQMAQRAALMHQQAAEKLRTVSSPVELMAIQSGLMMSGLREAQQYWQELGVAAVKMQTDMMGRAGQQQQQAASTTANAGAASVTLNNPMLQAWQAMFNPAQMMNGSASARSH